MQNPLEIYLDAADGAGNVLAHAKLLIKLSKLYQKVAPLHLGQASCLANYKSGVIVIHAASGAVAAKLRQLAPTLAGSFSKMGIECNDVQVKVQARQISKQSSTSTQKPLSATASRELENLCASLPSSTLREALQSLLTRAAKQE